MSVSKFIRGIFGIPEYKQDNQFQRQDDMSQESKPDEFRNPIWNSDEDDDDDDFRTRPPYNPFGFQIFNDPIEIHRHFEHQMEAMSRIFQMFEPSVFGNVFSPPMPDQEQNKNNLRDNYLKPGYTLPDSKGTIGDFGRRKPVLDSDLDDRIKAGDIDKIFEEDKPCVEHHQQDIQTKVFGKASFSTTVRKNDGTVEHHRTMRDHHGNEEVTVTRQLGDQSYSVTTKTDSKGEKQQIENFVNLEKEELEEFTKKWSNHRQTPQNPETNSRLKEYDSLFDRFFK